MNLDIFVVLISFFAGSLVTLASVFFKYLLDYRIERRKLELEERHGIATVLGSSQSNLVRTSRDLFRRISNFFDRPDPFRQWLKPGPTPESDAHALREFARLLFEFISWGRITQEAINSLPTADVKERPDLQQAFVFVDLVLDLLAYGGLFSGITAYDAEENQNLRLFMGDIDAMAEVGMHLWTEGEQNISRAAFYELYRTGDTSLIPLRSFLVLLHTDQTASASFIVARLAALRAILAGFLIDYSWTIDVPKKRILVKDLKDHLRYASETSKVNLPFVDFVPHNLSELMRRYNCKFFRLP